MSGGLLKLPEAEFADPVFSNFDGELDGDVVRELSARPGELYAQHAAWGFCGYVWRLPDGRWVDQVWRFGTPVEDFVGDSVEDVVAGAREEYGYE